MPKICQSIAVLTVYLFFPLFLTGQSLRDQYRANAPFHVLYDVQQLADEKKLYAVRNLMPEIAVMIEYVVVPYPQLQYYSKRDRVFKSTDQYLVEFEQALATQSATERIASLTVLDAYVKNRHYFTLIDSLLTEQKKRKTFLYYEGMEDWATSLAAAGQLESANILLTLIGNNRRCDRAYMHLAVKKAANGQPKHAPMPCCGLRLPLPN